jgi:hypothetical protein
MYRWQKPPILPIAYASAQRSSKRRWRSIECRSSRFSAGSDAGSAPFPPRGFLSAFGSAFVFFVAM